MIARTRRRILLVAHHANPELTSEPLIGWRWAKALDSRCDVTLVTHIRNQGPIERDGTFGGRVEYVDTERLASRVKSINDRIFPGQGSVNRLLLETICQRAFDREAVRIAERLGAEGAIDVIHRVSPISPRYRTRLAKVGLPFVIGPVNGGMTMPEGFAEIARNERQAFLRLRGLARFLDPSGSTFTDADMVLVANETTREALPRSVRDRAELLCENAVLAEDYEPSYERNGEELRALYLGRLLPYKGVQFALRALAAPGLERVRLDVVGDGEYRAELEAECARLGLEDRVVFRGAVPQHEVPERIADCDVLVLPSVRESGGSVPLEAMAAGKPVIVADHGGPSETVAAGTGFRVPCPDPEALTAGLARALAHLDVNEDRRERMGRAARVHVDETYTWDAKAERALDLYERALERRTKGNA